MENSKLQQNLVDAGCGKVLADKIAELLDKNKTDEALALLFKHRKEVLNKCHEEQSKIDCLDYLVYRLKKESKLP